MDKKKLHLKLLINYYSRIEALFFGLMKVYIVEVLERILLLIWVIFPIARSGLLTESSLDTGFAHAKHRITLQGRGLSSPLTERVEASEIPKGVWGSSVMKHPIAYYGMGEGLLSKNKTIHFCS